MKTLPTQPVVESSGPFQIIGKCFGMIGNVVNLGNTVISSVDRSATRIAMDLDKGFDAVDLVIDNAMLDFANDNLVADAKRRIRAQTAQAEADVIIAGLESAVKAK